MKTQSVVTTPDGIDFIIDDIKLLELQSGGDIFVRGKLVENNQEVVDGFKAWLEKAMKNG